MTDLAPWSMAYWMVGTAPAIRCVFVTCLLESSGTLKSTWVELRQLEGENWAGCSHLELTLMRTRFPIRSTSLMESLFARDMFASSCVYQLGSNEKFREDGGAGQLSNGTMYWLPTHELPEEKWLSPGELLAPFRYNFLPGHASKFAFFMLYLC